ncbi:MAG: DUF3179 domain-containing protein [Caldilineaceae bacterium SB0668_bin_21]|nr:DUF3179 domain-containing protein [Caldilineaceae bacterium SB0668_bin_21]MYC22092.1 DUF3179 domain-containing protein [Caldilineaceae bacterium SB0662_bin_25]
MIATFILLACVPIGTEEAPAQPAAAADSESGEAVTADSGETDSSDSSAQATASVNTGVPQLSGELITDGVPPPFRTRGFSTDFSRRTVEWDSILSGGPPKDGIPAVDNPEFESIAAGDEWLEEVDPVILYSHGDVSRAYPLSILIWHEIVNDEVDGQPVSITFCPLCNASIAFDRNFDGQVLDFGTTGRLRNSDLIMYDRQTETWWQQFTGEGIVGKYAGEQLRFLTSQVLSWKDFKEAYPDGEVLARPNMPRNYGYNPYVGYDSTSRPFLFRGTPDSRLAPAERVLGLTTDIDAIAYPFTVLEEAGVVHDSFGGLELAIFHKAGLASALDSSLISQGRDIGTVAVYDRQVGDQLLTFSPNEDGSFSDAETGSTWDILGEAVAGPLAGEKLTPILHFDHFWFAWAAFFPETELYNPS